MSPGGEDAVEFWVKKFGDRCVPFSKAGGAVKTGLSQLAKRFPEQGGAETALTIFHQDAGPGRKMIFPRRIGNHDRGTDHAQMS